MGEESESLPVESGVTPVLGEPVDEVLIGDLSTEVVEVCLYSVMALVRLGRDDGDHLSLCPRQLGRSIHESRVHTHRDPHRLRCETLDRGDVPYPAGPADSGVVPVSYTHLRAHETDSYLVCR